MRIQRTPWHFHNVTAAGSTPYITNAEGDFVCEIPDQLHRAGELIEKAVNLFDGFVALVRALNSEDCHLNNELRHKVEDLAAMVEDDYSGQ